MCDAQMNWILPGRLAVGNMHASANHQLLKRNHIHGIVTARESLSLSPMVYRSLGIDIMHIRISDEPQTNIGKYFAPVFRFIDDFVDGRKPGAVLVHCAAGISRSTTLVISYLIRKFNWTDQQAIAFVTSRRPCCEPNVGFLKQLQRFSEVWSVVRLNKIPQRKMPQRSKYESRVRISRDRNRNR